MYPLNHDNGRTDRRTKRASFTYRIVSSRREGSKPKRKQASSLAALKSTLKTEATIAATTCQDSDRISWRPG
eukprot:5187191-Pyramimonas_sp.AAC.1